MLYEIMSPIMRSQPSWDHRPCELSVSFPFVELGHYITLHCLHQPLQIASANSPPQHSVRGSWMWPDPSTLYPLQPLQAPEHLLGDYSYRHFIAPQDVIWPTAITKCPFALLLRSIAAVHRMNNSFNVHRVQRKAIQCHAMPFIWRQCNIHL